MPEPVEVTVARLEGKIDLLGEKLDVKLAGVVAAFEAGDRESGQKVMLVDNEVGHLRVRVDDHDRRITSVSQEALATLKALDARVDALDNWKAKMVGLAIGSAVGGGTLGAAIVRAASG